MLVAQLCPVLCNPMDYSLPGSSALGILQGRILEWVAVPFSRGSFRLRDRSLVSCIAGRFFTTEPPGKPNQYHMVFYFSKDRCGGFPGGAVIKNLPTNAGDVRDQDSFPASGRSPWRRVWLPTPVFFPGESHGQRSLVGYKSMKSQRVRHN